MCAYAASPDSSMLNDAESSLLLDECRGHVAYSYRSPCQSISSWVFLVFLSHAHIHPWSASFGYLVWSILFTWPICCIRRCCTRSATSWSRPTLSHTSLFLILSLRVTPASLLKQDILNIRSRFSCVCFKIQVSELYINTLSTTVSYLQLRGVRLLIMSVDNHTFFYIWNTVLANPILLLIIITPSLVLALPPR